jgi:hypothetical protein
VCHGLRLLGFGTASDAFDFQPGEFATVTDRSVITLATPILEGDDLFVFAPLNHFSRDFSAVADLSAIDVHQDFERGGLARLGVQKIDINRVAFRDAILPATSLDDCVSHKVFSGEKKPRKITQKRSFGNQK